MYGDNCDCATRSLLGVKEDTDLMKVQSLQDEDHGRGEMMLMRMAVIISR